ncbi:MAG: hypothetical protein AAGK93_11115, partial [Pseudomonadota bacterium]
ESAMLNMIPGSLEIEFPASETRKELYFLLRSSARLDVRLPDNTRLTPDEVFNSVVSTGSTDVWQIFRVILPRSARRVSVCALAGPAETAATLGSSHAAFVGAEMDAAVQQNIEHSERHRSATSELITDTAQNSADWANGEATGLLKPGTQYELIIEAKTRHARRRNGGDLEVSDAASNDWSRTVRFRTEEDIMAPMRALRPAVSWDNSVSPEWTLDTNPRPEAVHYRRSDIAVEFADAVAAGRVASHGREFALELVHESGRSTQASAERMLAQTKQGHSELQDIIGDWLDNQACLNNPDPLWLSLKAVFPTLLEPGRYHAKLTARDLAGRRDAAVLYEWRFSASRFKDLSEHVAAHKALYSPRPGLAIDSLNRTSNMFSNASIASSDKLFEKVWIEGLGMQPLRPGGGFSARFVMHEDGVSGVLIDGPEPLMQSGVQVQILQSGLPTPLACVASNSGGTRTVFCPLVPIPFGDAIIRVTGANATADLTTSVPDFADFMARL